MKKKISVIILCILVLFTSGCTSSNIFNMDYPERKSFPKAFISRNDGVKEYKTYEELWNMYQNDRVKFEKEYGGAKIFFVGNLDRKYKKDRKYKNTTLDVITFKEGWNVVLITDSYSMPILIYNSYLYVRTNIYVTEDSFDFRGTNSKNEISTDTLLDFVIERVDCDTEEEMIGTINYNYQVHNLSEKLDRLEELLESIDYKSYNKNLKKTATLKKQVKELQSIVNFINTKIEYELFAQDSVAQVRGITTDTQKIIDEVNGKKKISNKDIPSEIRLFRKVFALKITDDNIKTIE